MMSTPLAGTSHEVKYVLNNSKVHQVICLLETCFVKDPEFPAGTVSSIYYDTRDWRFLGEKINSDYLKTKVRVRWYSDIDGVRTSDASFIEVKCKIGSARRKLRFRAPFTGRWLDDAGLEDNRLLDVSGVLMSEGLVIEAGLRPVFQVSYRRRRYIEPISGSRICIDYDISAPRINAHVLPRANPFCLRNAVFEMKGTLYDLPFSLHSLVMLGARRSSFSKYSTCHKKLTMTPF